MGNPAADAAMYRFYADMLDAYGEEWPDRLLDDLKFDPDGPEIELPPPIVDPAEIQIVLTIRVPQSTYRRMKARATAAGLTIEELLTIQADADDGPGKLPAQ